MTLHMGKLIRQLRKQQGITQKTLGAGIISKSVLSRIENGLTEPDLFTLNALLQRLGKTLEYFEIVVSNKEYEMIKHGEYNKPLQTMVVAEGDYVRDIRKARGLSQEKFSSDILARETISNIEHGRAPQYKKIQTLMKKLEEPFEKYHGFVFAQNYEVYELVSEYQSKVNRSQEKAEFLLGKIAEQIDDRLPVNRQFLESSELMEERKKGILTVGEELAGLERCLRYTMPEYDGKIYRIPFCQEVVILEEIAGCFVQLEKMDAAKELDNKIKEKSRKKLKVS